METTSSGDLQRSLLPTTHESNEKREHNVKRNKAVVTVDMIIERYVGRFGKAQLLHVAVVALAWAVDAMHTLVAVFSDSQPPWRCVSESSSSCTHHSSLCQLDQSQWEWTDGPGATIVSEWGLICSHKFSAGVPASLFFIGCIIGSGVLGPLSDNWLGRKKTLLLSCGIVTACGFLTALAPNIWIYSALRMMSGFGRAGVGTNSLVLSTEPLSSRLRGKVGLYGFLFFMAGFASLPGIAFITRTSWRETYIVISSFSLLYCCILMQFSWESAKWLMLQHREEEALQVLRSMAAWNSGSIPEDIEVAMETPQGKGNNGRGKWKLLKVGWARKRMALVMAGAAGTGLVYFGLPLNVGNVKSMNPYVSTLVNAVMEVPAVAAGSVLLPTTRRRTMVMVVSSACGVCCWVCAGFAKWKWLVMVSEVLGFLGACFVFDVWYIYCMEMFATEVRSGAVGAMRQAIMGGAALAPCVAVLGRGGQSASFALFGSMSFVTAFVSFFLPETLGAHQCETLEEQERQAVVVSDPVLLT